MSSWGALCGLGWAKGGLGGLLGEIGVPVVHLKKALLKCLKKRKDNTKKYTCGVMHFGLGGLGGLGGPRSHGGPTDAILIVAQKCI